MSRPYRVAVATTYLPLDPGQLGVFPRDAVLRQLFDTLVEVNGDFEIVPGLATRWEIDKAERRLDFTLGESRFHDGRLVTAHDVKFSLDRTLKAKRPALNRIRSVKVHSDRHVSIYLSGGNFDMFLRALSICDAAILPSDFNPERPIGSGPYRLLAVTPGGHRIALERVRGDGPEQIEFLRMTYDEVTASFANGELDEADSTNFPKMAEPPAGSVAHPMFLPVIRLIAFGNTKVFADRANRLELTSLIPRERVHDEIYPFAFPAYSTIPTGLQGLHNFSFPVSPAPVTSESTPREVVLGTTWEDEIEPWTRLFNEPTFCDRGWKVTIKLISHTIDLYAQLESGKIDGFLASYLAKFYEPTTIFEIFSQECWGAFAASGDAEYEDLLSRAREAETEERLRYHKLLDERMAGEAFALPLAQNCNRKFVRRDGPRWITGRHIQLWDRLGVISPTTEENASVELNRMFSALKQASSIVSDRDSTVRELVTQRELAKFAAQVAHDIRSPIMALSVIESSLDELPEEKRQCLRLATSRIREIAETLLTRIHQPRAVIAEPPVAVSAKVLVESVVDEKRVLRPDLQWQVEGEGGGVRVDGVVMKRVLSNLLNNAAEAIDGSGTVVARLACDDRGTRIRIEDDGCGIPAAVLAELDKNGGTFGKVGGAGLGLSHARETLRAWGGSLELQSREGEGTAVELFFPH